MAKFSKIWAATIICLGLISIFSLNSYAESVALSWIAPTTDADGSPVTNLAGFNIYQGTTSGVYDAPIDVGMILCRIILNLSVGSTYYWVATAYDSAANESTYSNEVSSTITTGMNGNCSGAAKIQFSRNYSIRSHVSRSQVTR